MESFWKHFGVFWFVFLKQTGLFHQEFHSQAVGSFYHYKKKMYNN